MTEPIIPFTHAIRRFTNISDTEGEEVFRYFKRERLAAGQYFVKKDQVCDSVGFIESGMVRHFYLQEGEEVTRWVSLENEFVTALSSFISAKPCSHYLQAIGNCRIWTLRKPVWTELLQNHAFIREFWLRVLEFNVMGFEDRIYQQLAGDAEQRYRFFMERFPEFIEKVPQKYIASMIGIKPESLSRLRKKLAKK
jgi:CRP-like cAMP-binding protein